MKILGLGNALVDILVRLENNLVLEEIHFPLGSMQLVDNKMSEDILTKLVGLQKDRASGGSAANTIHGLGKLGAEVGYIGKVGKDEVGDFFSKDIKESGAKPHLLTSKTASGTAIAMISLDSERTFATNLGAAIELKAEELTDAVFKDYNHFHLEGYIVMNHELLEAALIKAKENNMKVSIDLASFNVVEDNLDFLKKMVEKYVDIVFANEEEAKAFTGKEPVQAIDDIAKICSIAVVKLGAEGSLIKKGNKTYKVDAFKVNSIDTTGAGDLFASGFLYGLSKSYNLEKSAKIGSLTASYIIQEIGAKMSDEKWAEIKEKINLI